MVEQEGGDCMGNQDPTEQGHAGECDDDTLDRTWLTWLQQETTTRKVREDQVYPVTQETQERGNARARLELERLVVPLVPPGRSQYLYNGGISSVDFTRNPIPPN